MEITSNLDRYSPFIEGGKGKKDLYLRLEKRPTPDVVRIVSEIYGFRQHWTAFRSISNKPIVSPAFTFDEKHKDIAWDKGGWEPGKKYSAVVINRETGQLQILTAGAQVFNPIFQFIKNTKAAGRGVDPAGENGPDWIISVESDVKNKTKYECSIDSTGPKNFTADELERIAKWPADWKEKYIKVATEQEIVDLWNQLPEDKKMAPPKEQRNQAGFPRNAVQQPAQVEKVVQPVPAQTATAQATVQPAQEEEVDDNPPSLF